MKCRRCKSVVLSEDTCGFCGEPHSYITYHPDEQLRRRVDRIPTHTAVDRNKPTLHNDLLREITAFRHKYSFPKSVFGRRFANDPSLVNRLENGSTPRECTVREIRKRMSEYVHH